GIRGAQRGALAAPGEGRARRPAGTRRQAGADAGRGHGSGAAYREQRLGGGKGAEPARRPAHRRADADGVPITPVQGGFRLRGNRQQLHRRKAAFGGSAYSNIRSTLSTCTSASPFAPNGNFSISLSVASCAAGFSAVLPLASCW